METKTQKCSHCGEVKPLTSQFFHRCKSNGSGLHTVCKPCRSKQAVSWSKNNIEGRKAAYRKYSHKLKMDVLTAYCKGEPFCQCCGDKHIEFLSLDHKNGDGAKQRRELNSENPKSQFSNKAVYRWARQNNYPDTLQVLCHNCNRARYIYGECPHEREK